MIHLLKPFLLGLLTISSLHADIVFDLQEQYFEHAHEQNSNAGLYKLENATVSTVNLHQSKNGQYITEYDSSGMLIVRVNKPLKDFSISIKARYKSTYKLRTSSIVLKSNNGDEFIIILQNNQIIIQNETYTYQGLYQNMIHLNIEKVDGVFKTSINGKLLSAYKMEKFTLLKRLEQTINNVNGVSSQDCIYDTVIAGK